MNAALFVIRWIIDCRSGDVVTATEKLITQAGVTSADEVRLQPRSLVRVTVRRRESNLELRDFLYKKPLLYMKSVEYAHIRARHILRDSSIIQQPFIIKSARWLGDAPARGMAAGDLRLSSQA